jgi:hypothetical protein
MDSPHRSRSTTVAIIIAVVLPLSLLGGGVWMGVLNERQMVESARASAETRLVGISALNGRIALLATSAPVSGEEHPLSFPTLPTSGTAIAIHEEDLGDLTAPGSVKFRWCSDTAMTVACLARKGEWGQGKPLKWQEKKEAADRMREFSNIRYVFVVRMLTYEGPTHEGNLEFKGGEVTAKAFVFDLDANNRFLGQLEVAAHLSSVVSGPDLHRSLRHRCRAALKEALQERVQGADCDAGTF